MQATAADAALKISFVEFEVELEFFISCCSAIVF